MVCPEFTEAPSTVRSKSFGCAVPPLTSLITLRETKLSSQEPKVSPWAKWEGTADLLTIKVNALETSPLGTWHTSAFGVGGGIVPLSSFFIIQVREVLESAKPRHSVENVASYSGSGISDTA